MASIFFFSLDFNSIKHLHSRLTFLVATKRLFKRVCPSVGLSDSWSVGDAFAFRPSRSLLRAVYPALFHSFIQTGTDKQNIVRPPDSLNISAMA